MASSFQIVLNYRREDSSGHAGRLYDDLARRFGDEHIFMDIDAIDPGVDFTEAIERAVGSAQAFLALIGPRWLDARASDGSRRLDKPGDFVRLEIEAALRPDVLVIPVLVQDAQMPKAEDLPPSLEPLTRRNALEIRDSSWQYDVGRLIRALEKVEEVQLGDRHSKPAPPARGRRELEKPSRWTNRMSVIAGGVALLAAAVLAVLLLRGGNTGDSGGAKTSSDPAPIELAVEPSVEHLTYGHFLDLYADGSTAPPSEARQRGVAVLYDVAFPGYAKGAPFRTRFTLYDKSGRVSMHTTKAKLDAEKDECRCSEFVRVPGNRRSYYVLVEVYRPGEPWALPVRSDDTDWFTGSDTATS